ncbi:MAG: hypothetical protein ACR2LA_04150 [Acidimicrobiales bacterium]
MSMFRQCGGDRLVGDEVRALVQAVGESGGDPFLKAEHLDRGEQRFLASADLDDVAGGEEFVDHRLQPDGPGMRQGWRDA